MRHPPRAKLPHDGRFARHWKLFCPSTIDPDAKTPARRERQIDQFQPEPLSGVMVPKQQRIMRFGTRHAPF
jgi:hypothetical protein